jgi:hypothetical protein
MRSCRVAFILAALASAVSPVAAQDRAEPVPAEEEVLLQYDAVIGPGGEVELVPHTPGIEQPLALAGIDDLRPIAVDAAKQLLEAAKETVCDFEPLPETVSPSVEVHFSILAGGSFSISATWSTADICTE